MSVIPSVSEPDLKNTKRRKQAFRDIDSFLLGKQLPNTTGVRGGEEGVIGCVLVAPNECLDKIIIKIGERYEVFYDLRHQELYRTFVEMREQGRQIDILTVQQFLKDKQMLEMVGGLTYLMQLQDEVPSAANLPSYLDAVCEKYLLRTAVLTCSELVNRVYESEESVEDYLDEMESKILAIRQTFQTGRGVVNIEGVQQHLIEIYEQALSGVASGLLTGFHDIDHKLGGCMPQELIIVGGTPSSGKTTICMNMAYNIAVGGTKVSIKSLETSVSKVVHRIHCYAGRVDSGGFFRGSATNEQMQQMMEAVLLVRSQRERLMITDEGMTDAQLVASCRQDYQQGARLFVVDMLQNVQAKGKDEYAVVTAASKCLKNIAKELNVPVIAVSALSRIQTNESGVPRRPTMHDVRQSGQIESDADKMILLHSPEREGDVRQVTAIIAKNKDGPLGDIELTFFANQFRFESAEIGQEPEAEQQHQEVNQPYADQ